jgi:hypothetical protein
MCKLELGLDGACTYGIKRCHWVKLYPELILKPAVTANRWHDCGDHLSIETEAIGVFAK